VARSPEPTGTRLLNLWGRLSALPGGRWLFSRLIGVFVPYSGSMGISVRALEPGYARLELPDRRRVRNHLRSIHAVALVNAGELASGLALMTGIPPHVRGIPTGLSAEYPRKARGPITVEARVDPPSVGDRDVDHEVTADLRDRDGELVCRVRVAWRLGPRPGAVGAGAGRVGSEGGPT
jgi:acyl-coenzyme A thioesterase PaaI-like protein